MPELQSQTTHFDVMKRFFFNIDDEALTHLAQETALIILEAGEFLFRQGEKGSDMYLIANGQLQVTIAHGEDVQVSETLSAGEAVGEMTILTSQPRTAHVSALSRTELIRIPKQSFLDLATQYPQAMEDIADTISMRFRRMRLKKAVGSLFGPLEAAVIQAIEAESCWMTLQRGEKLFKQGDVSDALYIIVVGRLLVSVINQHGKSSVIQELTYGDSIGESELLSKQPRMTSVSATRETHLLKITRDAFLRLVNKYPALLLHMTEKIVGQLAQSIQYTPLTSRNLFSFTLVPLSDHADLQTFARTLQTILASLGSVGYFRREDYNNFLAQEGLTADSTYDLKQTKVAAWLDEQAAKYRIVLYEADLHLSEWTEYCISEADHVLLVADHAARPEQTEVETRLQRPDVAHVVQSLVLLYRSQSMTPSNTKKWLAPRSVHRHYHIALDRRGDFERLARFLTQRAVAVALGGGGARGYAHVGVIRALREAGIPIDLIGGTSAGAFIAAQYACGWDIATMIDVSTQSNQGLRGWTLPFVSITDGKHFSEGVQRFFGGLEIEDTPLPFFATSTNLSLAELKVHTSGLLWRAVRASMTIAGIFPPLVFDGHLHVDGALLDNLPVDVAKHMADGGRVIGVDVSPPIDLVRNTAYGDSVSGWDVLWSKLRPTKTQSPIPNIYEILMRAFEVGAVHDQKTLVNNAVADFYMRPPLEEFNIFDFGKSRAIIDAGYRYALTEVDRIQSELVKLD